MQVRRQRDLPKRSRFYHSLMDQTFLKRGESYSKLNPQYVIFICAFDPFDKGYPVYDFSMMNKKTGLKLNDESYTIFLNTKADQGNIPEELRSFYNYIDKREIDDSDEFIRSIHEEVVELNDETEWRDSYMTFGELMDERYEDGFEEGLAKGKAEGLAEGLAEGKAEGLSEGKAEGLAEGKAEGLAQAAKNLRDAGLPVDAISKATGLTEEEIGAL